MAKNNEQEMRKAFQEFDTDNSGGISKEELKIGLQNLGEKLSPDELDKMMKKADKDGNGVIDYNEFVDMMMQRKK